MPLASRPPFDRTTALACSIRTLRRHWLELRCCRGVTLLPLEKLVGHAKPARSLADVVVLLRCAACGNQPAAVALLETAQAPPIAYGGRLAWRLELVGPAMPPETKKH